MSARSSSGFEEIESLIYRLSGDRTDTVCSKKFSHEWVGGDFLSSTRLVSMLSANRVVIRLPSGAAAASRIKTPASSKTRA